MATTPLGGITQSFTNSTGAVSVPGTIVRMTDADPTAIELASSTDADPCGVVYTAVANGAACEVVVSGAAYILLAENCPCAMGQRIGVSPNEAGYGEYDSEPSWVGQAAESVPKPGAGVHCFVLANVEPAAASSESSVIFFTDDGGLAVKMLNGTLAASVKGMVVSQDGMAENSYIATEPDPSAAIAGLPGLAIGVVAESGVAPGSLCLVTISGKAYVNVTVNASLGYVITVHESTSGAAGCGRYSLTNPRYAQGLGAIISDTIDHGLYLCIMQVEHTIGVLISAMPGDA